VKVGGRTVVLEGGLGKSGLQRLGTVIHMPTPKADAKAGAENKSKTDDPPNTATATQAYYKALRGYLDDVHRSKRAKDYQQSALWIGRYARRIRDLPILNVDPELQEFGAFAAARLQDISNRLKGIQTGSAKRMASHQNFYDTNDTGGSPKVTWSRQYTSYYGDGDYRSEYNDTTDESQYRMKYQEGERRQIRMEEKASGKEDVRGMMSELEQEMDRIRRVLTQRYQLEF